MESIEKPIRISVIMPSYLGNYSGAASNRVAKFMRAVNSFRKNIIKNPDLGAELIIVSDGCEITRKLYYNFFDQSPSIKYIEIEKQDRFSGNVRQAGLDIAKGTIITYLDTDDFISCWHLKKIVEDPAWINPDISWIYYDEVILIKKEESIAKKQVSLEKGSVGTSSISHRRLNDVNWSGCHGYGHDWTFVQKLMKYKHQKSLNISEKPTYVICHIPNVCDC